MSTDTILAQLLHDVLHILILIIRDGDDTHLLRRKSHGEIARIMLEQKADHALMRGERRAVNAQWHVLR